ncbi:protein of unknown function [Mesotoga infera]|uniref:Uncharacterized protein n=1 Tax=Mesotoga infera TaxID=1236046 RepID=A0A7Z7LE01_9BACT|nr:protein of unknown function [Mesotoga infera]
MTIWYLTRVKSLILLFDLFRVECIVINTWNKVTIIIATTASVISISISDRPFFMIYASLHVN